MSDITISGTDYFDVSVVRIPTVNDPSEYAEFTNRESAFIDGSFSGVYENDQVTTVRAYVFYNFNCTAVKMANLTTTANYTFSECKMKTIEAQKLAKVGNACFKGCVNLEEAIFPLTPGLDAFNAFQSCKALKKVDIGGPATASGNVFAVSAFDGCTALDTIIIRSDVGVVRLAADNVFSKTPVASGTGFVYVPRAIISAYREHESWATYKEQLRSIEDYPDICG